MKVKYKEKFLEELRKIPVIQVACEKTGISRNTLYRWKKESKTFSDDVEKALCEGISYVNDMSETQLMNMIKGGDFKAVSFWLRHRNDSYKQKVQVEHKLVEAPLTKEQKETIRKTLKTLTQHYEKK